MTKEEFNNYNGLLHCLTCNAKLPKWKIDVKKVHKNGDILRCKVCEWEKRHPEKLLYKNFNYEETHTFLHFLFYDESIYLNEIANKINKTIDEVIDLYQFLKVGNKRGLIRTVCEYCGNECEFPPQAYKNSKYHYCCHECYYNDKSNKIDKGEQSQFYNRIKTTCTNCSKEINIIPYRYKKENSFGESNNFCSQQCYWEYRSIYYQGDNWSGIREWSEEQKEQQRYKCATYLKNMPTKNTSIQVKICELLDSLKINYEQEYVIKYYSADIYLIDYSLIIEIMGDYWHGNPLKYNTNGYKLNQTQYKDIIKDKSKNTYIKKYYNSNILYLWETDIKNNLQLCEKLIQYFISKEGIIENYNSYNWHLSDSLELNHKIVNPYFEDRINEAKQLLVS